jgi:tetratricopeptide (TPR) repeat protein
VGVVALVALRRLESAWKREREGPRRLALGAGLTLAAGLAAAFLLVPRETRAHLLGLFTGAGAADASSAYRLDTAAATARLFAGHALTGAGFGAYVDAITAYTRAHGDVRTTHAESDVLEALAEGGLVGLALLLWLAARVGRGLRERLGSGHDALQRGLVAGAGAALVALGVHSLFDFNLRLPANALIAASLLGLVAAGRRPRDVDGAPSPVRARFLTRVASAALVLLACAAGWRAAGAWRLERALALPAAQRLGALDAVLAAHPWRVEAWRARGLAWRDLRHADAPSSADAARLARAERDLSRALQLRPAWADAWADRAWVRLLRGDATGARADADRAAALDPTHVGICMIRAEIHARGGAVDEALRQLARLLDDDPTWAAAALQAALRWTDSDERLARLVAGDPHRAELLRQARRTRAGP